METSHRLLAERTAREFDLPPDLVVAICITESAGKPWASRFEPHYRWLWDFESSQPYTPGDETAGRSRPPADFTSPSYSSKATEWIHQKTSFGHMQVMGAVARELGFKEELPKLCDPVHGLRIGCKLLAKLCDRWLDKHGWAGVVAAYNAGQPDSERGTEYAYKVCANGAHWLFS